MLQKQEMDQINKGWPKIMIIWVALMGSLGIYLAAAAMIIFRPKKEELIEVAEKMSPVGSLS